MQDPYRSERSSPCDFIRNRMHSIADPRFSRHAIKRRREPGLKKHFSRSRRGGNEAGRRTRVALGHRDCEAAKTAAERAAIALREQKVAPRGALRLRTLFDNYMREVSPQKGPSAQHHDKRAVKLF